MSLTAQYLAETDKHLAELIGFPDRQRYLKSAKRQVELLKQSAIGASGPYAITEAECQAMLDGLDKRMNGAPR